jgi:hypothetical protein
LVEVHGAEDHASIAGTLSDTRDMWTGESVIALRIQWSQGLAAILRDFEAILRRHSPQPTPGAHDNLDDRSARGKRIGNGELDPALECLEAVSLLENGLAVMEVARRLDIDRRKIQRAKKHVSDLLFEWFVREQPAQ